MIAVLYATEKEARPLLDRVQAVPVDDAACTIFSVRVADRDLLIAISGMGMPAAEATCRHLVQTHHVDTILNVGICAGLADDTPVGTLYTVEEAFVADALHSKKPSSMVGVPLTAWPGMNAKRLGSVSEPLFDTARRDAIATQCELVDMEGAAVAQACRELGVACHLLKGVSDDARPGSRDTLMEQLEPVSRLLAEQVIQDLPNMSPLPNDTPLVFAAAPYLNAAPLVEGFLGCDDVRVINAAPADLGQPVMSGEADAGLLPIVDCLFSPELDMIDGIGVGANGPVGSVLLHCHKPLDDVRSVAADPNSSTSNLLAQLILRAHLGSDAIVYPGIDSAEADAEILIGDRALTSAPNSGPVYDLAEQWKQMTGLPFVFAVWALRRDNPRLKEIAAMAHASLGTGEAALEAIAERYAIQLELPIATCRQYLEQNIHYHVGDPERAAITRFKELLTEHDLVPDPLPPSSRFTPPAPGRLSPADALDMLKHAPLPELMQRANEKRQALHGRRTTFVHSLNLNPTNVCENRCDLCAFWRETDAEDAYLLSLAEAETRLRAAANTDLTDLHIVGGITPVLQLDYYEALLRLAKSILPNVCIQALTAVEVHYLATQAGLSTRETLKRLKAAGLDAIPGGGAEIFAEPVRHKLCPEKISGDEWLRIHGEAHALGLPTNATMLFGHIESPEDIIDHMDRLRRLQDRTGGIAAFIPLPFHPDGTRLDVERGPSGSEIVRTVAVARLFLDNIPHVRVLANYVDRKLLEVLTSAGVDDLGGTSQEEQIAKAAGAPSDHRFVSVEDLFAFTRRLDLEPALVNSIYTDIPTQTPSAQDAPADLVSVSTHSNQGEAPLLKRLGFDEAVHLHDHVPFQTLCALAHQARLRAVPGNTATFVIDRNISLTNICTTGCRFCAFHVAPGASGSFTLSIADVVAQVEEALAAGATQVLIQGGLNPDLKLPFYEELLAAVKAAGVECVHSLSPTEIAYLAEDAGLTLRATLQRLRAAGLDSLPGGGAEILVDAVRQRVSPRKLSADGWLEVMRTAQELGMRTTATMVYGLGETTAQRVEHLQRIRDLQDETGGFTAFIPWSFQSHRTDLAMAIPTGIDYLRVVALARLFLDNIPHVQAGWVTEGPDVAQLALHGGADDFGGVLMEEKVVRATGVGYMVTRDDVISLIRRAGFDPVQRTTQYAPIRSWS